ncbi:MAG: hypothetical protein KIH08_12005 [Candidatus Freyarchaeota archaeon]|nr:hypothetical protein [Candidatus Jordarchaeia archaeon]MBS7267984.1 hypothetical protein [Candidatus Jordarchaeia archaeon]MBS7278345.1 hypothetical protein [Candidatus Jordarchaeia archaeon]
MSLKDSGWSDLEILQNISECFKLLKKGLESLKNKEFENALSFLSDASTLMYISLNRTITHKLPYRHSYGIIVQFNILVVSLAVSFLVRASQVKEEARESIGGATSLIALITAFLNPLLRSIIEQESKPDGYKLTEKDRYLLAEMMELNEVIRDFKKQFEEEKKEVLEEKPKKVSAKAKKTRGKS